MLIGESEDAHQQVYTDGGGYDNQAKFSHELIAGAASFEGFKLFEDHQRKEGELACSGLIIDGAGADRLPRQASVSRIRQGATCWVVQDCCMAERAG